MWLCDFGAPLEVCDGSNSVVWVYVNVMDNRILLNLFQGTVVPSDSLQDCPSSPSCTGPGGTQVCALPHFST